MILLADQQVRKEEDGLRKMEQKGKIPFQFNFF